MRKYLVKYIDKFGEENSEIHSDGTTMYIKLRGINFEGLDFEMLEGNIDENKFEYEIYENNTGDLTNFEMIVNFDIKIVWQGKQIKGNLNATITTGKEKGSNVHLELDTEFGKFITEKKHGWFEYALIEIQKKLPVNTEIKTCLSCKYSSYHPVGNSMFGGLNCFVNYKKEVSQIADKHDLMDVWEKGYLERKTVEVQETFDCLEHQFITKSDWTYKSWK